MATTMDGIRTARSCAMGVFAVLTLLCSVRPSVAFNLDTEHITRYYGRRSLDMFGFSVALHKDGQTGESWVLVGAPEAQSERQREVERGGAVYRCDILQERCAEVPFDQSEGNNRNNTYHDIDNKSHQWFGATIAAADSAVVACAPRYVNYPNTREERHDPVGTCWVARDQFARFNEYSPCRTSEWGYHRKGHCQAGLGASISKDGTQLFIGAPGSHYWQGQLFTVNATIFMPFLPPESIRVNTTSGQLFAENLHRKPEVYETPEGPSTDDDTYLGYSVTVGYFEGPGNTTVAVGRPRGDHLKGKVEIYSWDLIQLVDISGDQLGGYFGYSLCASDMDGDGKDDLVVGAPLFTEPNNEGKYETGRIYVMYQKDGYEGNDTRDGSNSRSRFGLSLCSIGDINKDGYGDIAVGAPYDIAVGDSYGRGAVYIYLGSKDGIREKPSQIIHAKDISRDFSTFGFSVSGGLDLDNNHYPDLVIGAYESNSAAFFRARPIVKVDANVTFMKNEVEALKQINLKDLNCNLQGSGKNDTICLAVRSCLEFNGEGVDNWHHFNVEVVLDSSKPRSSRMFFQDSSLRGYSKNFTARVAQSRPLCRDFNVYIKPNIRDKLTPLNVEMRYSLQPSRSRSQYLAPVLDLVLPPIKKDTLNIVKNCGPDNICIPDLKMKIEPSVGQYLLGTGEDFKLNVLVENKGEDAFEASYTLKLPLGLNYINIARLDKNQDVTVQCSAPSQKSNNTLICDIGNPLPSNKHVEFDVLMQPFYAEGLRSQYHFEMEVNSTNPEDVFTRKDNKMTMNIPISIQTDLSLMGASYPSDVHWNSIDYSKTEGFKEEAEIGPQVLHVHTIHNKGPADIVESEVYVVVPTSTFANDNILYLLEQPETDGPIKCEKVPEANFLNLKLDSKRFSYFEGHEKLIGSSDTFGSGETSSSSSSSSSSFSQSGISTTHDQNNRRQGNNREEDAPSEGGRRRGGSTSNEVTYHSRGGSHKLVGVDGGKAIHKDEGLEETFGQGGSEYSFQHSSQSFQNSSQSSRRVESQSGRSGPKIHSTSNFSASWSENGGPIHHYENHTSENGVNIESSEKHQNGRGQSTTRHQTGGRSEGSIDYDESRTSHSTNSEIAQSGRNNFDDSRGYQNRTRVYSGTGSYEGNSGVHHGSSGETHYSSRGHSDSHRDGQGYENTGFRENTDYQGNARRNYGQTGSNQATRGGYNDNEDDYENNDDYHNNDHEYGSHRYDSTQGQRRTQGHSTSLTSDAGYREYESHQYDSTQDIGRGQGRDASQDNEGGYNNNRQGYGSSRGVFKHYSDNWSSGEGNERHQSSNRGAQWSSGSDNIGHDNVNNDQRNVDSQYGNLGHRSQERTHQYSGSDYNNGGASHSSDNQESGSRSHHYPSSSSWGQSGTSNSGDRNYRGGSYGDDALRRTNIRQYYSANWDTDQSQDNANRNQGSDQSSSGVKTGTGRDQRVNEQSGGSGQFYTSSVLLGEDGNIDLGYAARGYGQNHDSFSNVNSKLSTRGHRKTTIDPDLADLGSQFTDRPDESHDQHSQSRDSQLRLYGRYQRSISENSLEDLLKCNATNCTRIHCTVGPLVKGQEVRVALRMRVWVPTMKKFKDNRIVKTSSRMVMQVTKLPYIGSPHDAIVRDHEVFTDIVSTDSPTIPDIVPLWVVVLSAVAGTIILLLLIFLLWKCGFFKRNRPADAAEKEPLNRNGHYSAGDEAL